MGLRSLFSVSMVVALGSTTVSAQQLPTTVQLPTFSFFTVNTTVVVPDRGGIVLGQLHRAAMARQFIGPGLPRGAGGRGAQRRVLGNNLTAHVHDLHAQNISAKGSPGSTPRIEGDELGAKFEQTRGSSASGAVASLAEIRHSRAVAKAAEQRAAERYVERAKSAESARKFGAAQVYYKMALRRASGSLADEILSRMIALDVKKDRPATARRANQ